LTEELTGRQRAAITAVCTDMHRPYLNAVDAVLTHAEIVFDKFHVLQHASAALDDVRRQEFFRAGAVMREHGRGKRWLLLRRWKTVRGSKRVELQTLFAANRRLFKAYVLREQLDRLWTYKTRLGVLNFLLGWIRALRWQRLPEMERLGDFLFHHIEGIATYCDHPVRFGVVESINTTIKAVLRRARGMRDEQMLVLKLKWATAHPIRSARDLARFLSPQGRYSTSEEPENLTQVHEFSAVKTARQIDVRCSRLVCGDAHQTATPVALRGRRAAGARSCPEPRLRRGYCEPSFFAQSTNNPATAFPRLLPETRSIG